ncbi:MAG: tryptophan synthase subunit alpha [Armatimonadota bacterium]|nr:tryptophan synthase subunit alpha [Armatimonadota bacterium]MDR7484735.1 tryptophan synthase subunit alpha [Armatimonadota bacterium]MDR7531850.1 tryptophan synthase subunit alpha [Armatimonadota bacterium]MDR7534805.1 tryptophan synthase subunit alpha [Armatimonadota bacterium]
MSRIADTFARLRARGRRALIPFLMAGDPSLADTTVFLPRLAEAGADLLEVGVPFSDPIADGPTNQRAAQRALAAGVRLRDVLTMVAGVRERLGLPLVLLTYYNPVLRYGLEAFGRDAAAAGVDGVVIPDLPPEDGRPLQETVRAQGLDTIFLVAPTSTDERLAAVAAAASGFVYCVSLTGVTGARTDLAGDVGALVGRLRRHTALPACVGFGISTPEHARQVASVADGVIVGSAVVALVEQHAAAAGEALERFVRALRAGVDAAPVGRR